MDRHGLEACVHTSPQSLWAPGTLPCAQMEAMRQLCMGRIAQQASCQFAAVADVNPTTLAGGAWLQDALEKKGMSKVCRGVVR